MNRVFPIITFEITFDVKINGKNIHIYEKVHTQLSEKLFDFFYRRHLFNVHFIVEQDLYE